MEILPMHLCSINVTELIKLIVGTRLTLLHGSQPVHTATSIVYGTVYSTSGFMNKGVDHCHCKLLHCRILQTIADLFCHRSSSVNSESLTGMSHNAEICHMHVHSLEATKMYIGHLKQILCLNKSALQATNGE